MKMFSKRTLAVSVLTVSLLGGGALATAHAGSGHHGGGHGYGMMMMGRGMDRMLDSVDATPEQRAQIKQIAEAARTDLKSQREAGVSLRDQARDLFVQPTVDAAAAETLRQQMMARADQASQRTLQAMLEISNVLTPEQRQKLAERMKQRSEHRQQRGERHHDQTR